MSVIDDGWRTQNYRQSIIARIDDAIRTFGMSTTNNSIEMENNIFQKATSREEYHGFVARLILHVRDMNNKKISTQGTGHQQTEGVPDSINALRNLVSPGTRNNQMLNIGAQQNIMGGQKQVNVNVFQALGTEPSEAIPYMPTNMQNRMASHGLQMGNQIGTISQMGEQIPNQMVSNNMNQLGGQMQYTLGNQLQGNRSNQVSNQQQVQLHGQMQMNTVLQSSLGGPMGTKLMGFSQNPTPRQFLQQNPSAFVQSPTGMGGPSTSNQMVTSPALPPSPGYNLNVLGNSAPPRSIDMASSPGISLNTPGQPIQSLSGLQDEQAYREKVDQLRKYVYPLRKIIAHMGNDGETVEKLSKMKTLLEILTNPQKRMPLETLLKCEAVLEKLDFKRSDGNVLDASGVVFKESHIFSPLLEAINNNAQNSVSNHTLHRTFGPTLNALFGPGVKLVPSSSPQMVEESISDIPDALQREIARLDQRFKVSLDLNQQPGPKSVQLICCLDERHLPCVPPISITVPEDYPLATPICHTNSLEYSATSFLSTVETALLGRINKLPRNVSLTQLLDTWEMSVRQAASGNNLKISSEIIMMGL